MESPSQAEFDFRGFNHVALVCRDMAETIAFYEDVLGMSLIKTIEFPGRRGQHYFLDIGNGRDAIAFFSWPGAEEGSPGSSLCDGFDDQMNLVGDHKTGIGTMNHLAFEVPDDEIDTYRDQLITKGIAVTETWNHTDSMTGARAGSDESDAGDVFMRALYFKDPNGIVIAFAAWTRELRDWDVAHAPMRPAPCTANAA